MIEVTLDKNDPLLQEAYSISQRIVERKTKRKHSDPYGRYQPASVAFQIGTLGEAAFVKLTGLEWHNRTDEDYKTKPDVGDFNVRTIVNPDHNLRLYFTDKEDRSYVLAWIKSHIAHEKLVVQFFGWITGKEGMPLGIIKKMPNAPRGNDEFLAVPKSRLWPMEDMPILKNKI